MHEFCLLFATSEQNEQKLLIRLIVIYTAEEVCSVSYCLPTKSYVFALWQLWHTNFFVFS